jgi:hypothetical protein
MSVNNFIPEVWSARVFQRLRKNLVFGDVVNRDYEGEINEFGDSVKINAVGPVTVAAYTKDVTTITPEALTDSQQKLEINRSYYFAFKVDDIDKRQAQGDLLSAGMDEAAYALANEMDAYIASLYSQAGSITASTPINSLNAYAALLSLGQALDEANVPEEGRFCIIPPWFKTKLLLAEVIVENTTNDAFQNGKIARCAGFDLRVSNNVSNDGTDYQIMAGVKRAISAADQIPANTVEAYRPEASFSDAVKGLHLYGAKVIDPDALAVLDATVLAEPV